MMLCLDLGNTRLKWGVFGEDRQLIEAGACLNADIETAPFYIWNECKHAVMATVARDSTTEQMLNMLKRYQLPVHQVKSSQHCHGLANGYDNPGQLGVDRWAAAVAAWQHLNSPCVVVSAGTAITIDAITVLEKSAEQAKFLGGYILPGLKMMQTRLSQGTANIGTSYQLLKMQDFPRNTSDAVQSGAFAAVCGAIKQMAQQLKAHAGELPNILLTGGDAAQVHAVLSAQVLPSDAIANQILVVDHLVLQGVMLLDLEREAA